MVAGDGGLGSAFVGEKIVVGNKNLLVTKLVGEGEYCYCTVEHFSSSQTSSNIEYCFHFESGGGKYERSHFGRLFFRFIFIQVDFRMSIL